MGRVGKHIHHPCRLQAQPALVYHDTCIPGQGCRVAGYVDQFIRLLQVQLFDNLPGAAARRVKQDLVITVCRQLGTGILHLSLIHISEPTRPY